MSARPAKAWPGKARARLFSCALLSLAACSDPSALDGQPRLADLGSDEPDSRDEARIGTLSFELQAAGDVTLNSFDYVITGPNFARTGSIDVSKSSTLSARIDAIPAGSGYSITVTGTSVGEPVTRCAGSAGFAIVARTVNSVSIDVSCRVARSVTPPEAVSAPLPRSSTWLCGLALLGLGVALGKRSRK